MPPLPWYTPEQRILIEHWLGPYMVIMADSTLRQTQLPSFYRAVYQVFFTAFPMDGELVEEGLLPLDVLEAGYKLTPAQEELIEFREIAREEVRFTYRVFIMPILMQRSSKSVNSCATCDEGRKPDA